MSHVKIELAGPSDDQALRMLQAQQSMPGLYQISYLRDPNFFKALNVEGRFHQTIIGRDQNNGTIVVFGNRSIKDVFVNGERTNIGYISGLRFKKGFNHVFSLMRGYQKLRQLDQDGRTQFYLTTIINENTQAKKLLTSKRRGLPQYFEYGKLHCKAISLAQKISIDDSRKITLRSATKDDLEGILKFLSNEGPRKQFYPFYQAEDFFSPDGLLTGFTAEDIIMASQGNKLVGIVGGWDQQSFRASQVKGYTKWLSAGRTAYNLWARLQRLPTLPNPGTKLNFFYLSLIAVLNDDNDVFKFLLCELMQKYKNRYDFMMAGLHDSHPLLPVLLKLKGYNYQSNLYLVSWEEGAKAISRLDDRPVYLELGAL